MGNEKGTLGMSPKSPLAKRPTFFLEQRGAPFVVPVLTGIPPLYSGSIRGCSRFSCAANTTQQRRCILARNFLASLMDSVGTGIGTKEGDSVPYSPVERNVNTRFDCSSSSSSLM